VHTKQLSSQLWSFLRSSKHVSSSTITVPLVEANIGIRCDKHVPEQHSSYSSFGPVGTVNEQNLGPQELVVKDHQFGAPGDMPQSDCYHFDSGSTRGGRHPAKTPIGEPLEGGHLQNDESFAGGQVLEKTPIGKLSHGNNVHGAVLREKECHGKMVSGRHTLSGPPHGGSFREKARHPLLTLKNRSSSSVDTDDMLSSVKNRTFEELCDVWKKEDSLTSTCIAYQRRIQEGSSQSNEPPWIRWFVGLG